VFRRDAYVKLDTEEGERPQWLLNKTPDGWIAAVGSHYITGWKGKLKLKGAGGAKMVEELWAGGVCTFRSENGDLSVETNVPRFDYRVYRIRL
jgi:hypothetical protein